MQFGVGPDLAAQCARAPVPDGWRPWFPDTDGPIPDALDKRAAALVADQSVALGSTESYPLPGVTTLIRIEPHIWSRDSQGSLVEGCFRAGAIYLPDSAPAGAGVTPPSSKLDRTVGILTAVSLAVGTVATLAAWGRK